MELWDHQKVAIAKARGKRGFSLFFSMGTGKTRTAIEILQERYQEHRALFRTLVLCPPIVIENWKREFAKYSDIKASDVIPLIGTGIQRLKLVEKHIKQNKIFITNYETLLMERVYGLLANQWHVEILVCDESHKLKNPTAKKSKQARMIGDGARYCYNLTGTPILNTPMDLFSQYRVLDGGKTFGTNFYGFRNTYFYDKNSSMPSGRYFPNWQLKPGAEADLNKKLEPSSMSIKKEECLDLPPLVQQTITVQLGPKQKVLYEQMKKDFITFVEDEACVAELAITKALRLQQILSGFVVLGDTGNTKLHQVVENPRADVLKELLEDITPHSKVLVWAVFKQDFQTISKLCEDLEIPYVEVHGEITPKKKTEAVDSFNTDGNVRVFIGHPGSGGIGINLVVASYSIFYSRNFSLEQDLQASARNHRGGSEIHEKVTRIDLVAEGTIDELILQRLKSKEAMGESIIRQMAKELK